MTPLLDLGRPGKGVNALVRLPRAVEMAPLLAATAERSLGIYPLNFHQIEPDAEVDSLVMGYANLSEPAIAEGVRRLSEALDAV